MAGFTTKISSSLEEIGKLVADNLVSMVIAETGSGKSVSIPPYLGDMAPQDMKFQVFTVVPTVQAALNLYRVQSQHFNHPSLGYAANSVVAYNKNTRLVYATYGHLRRQLIRNMQSEKERTGGLSILFHPFEMDILIIDEVHMSKDDITIILGIWDYFYERLLPYFQTNQISYPRLVMMSATPRKMEIRSFPRYSVWPVIPPSVVEPSHIKIFYHDNDKCLKTSNYFEEVAQVFLKLHQQYSLREYGDVLIFAPGEHEIRSIVREIKSFEIENLIILIAHSSLPQEEMEPVFLKSIPGFRKVIVSTNIAESSLTIEGVGIVISVPLEKIVRENLSGGTVLVTATTTRASLIQQAGRAARTLPRGVCYRMLTEASYMNDRIVYANLIPEIDRIPIHKIILELLSAAIDPFSINLTVVESRIRFSKAMLYQLALVEGPNQDIVTSRGFFVQGTTLSIQNSTALYNALKYEVPAIGASRKIGSSLITVLKDWKEQDIRMLRYGIVVAICLLDSYENGYFWLPKSDKMPVRDDGTAWTMVEYIKEHFAKFIEHDDLTTMLKLYLDYIAYTNKKSRLHEKTKKWAMANNIRHPVWKNFLRVLTRTSSYVEETFGWNFRGMSTELLDIIAIVRVLHPALVDAYQSNRYEKSGKGYFNKTNEAFLGTRRIFEIPTSNIIYGLVQHSIQQGGSSRTYLDVVIPDPLPPKLMEEEQENLSTIGFMKPLNITTRAVSSTILERFAQQERERLQNTTAAPTLAPLQLPVTVQGKDFQNALLARASQLLRK